MTKTDEIMDLAIKLTKDEVRVVAYVANALKEEQERNDR